MNPPERPEWPEPDTPDEVDPRDAEKVYGALSHYFITQAESAEQREIEDPVFKTPEDLSPPFSWGEYLEDCLEYLVDEYDGVEKQDGGYAIRVLEQEKHLERTHGR